jgi:hypothetical protein
MAKMRFWFIGEDGVRMRVHGADDIQYSGGAAQFMRHGEVFHTVPAGTQHGYFEVTDSLE